MPTMMVSIENFSEFLAEADVIRAHREKQDDDTDIDQIIHNDSYASTMHPDPVSG